MLDKTFTITSETGIHARPATLLVQTAGNYNCDVSLEFNDKKVNLKSIMGVMALGIPQGSSVKIITDGDDEDKALQAIESTIKKEGLGE